MISEGDLLQRTIDTARWHGWLVCHVRPARTAAGWRTPLTGDPGLPDVILARRGRVVLAELKSERGRFRPGQREWLDALGEHGRLFRPSDWPAIQELLTEKR